MTDTTLKHLRTVLVAIGAVFMAGVAAAEWAKLPARLAMVEVRLDSVETQHISIHTSLRRLQTTMDQQLCLQLAEREHTDWRHCIFLLDSTLTGHR